MSNSLIVLQDGAKLVKKNLDAIDKMSKDADKLAAEGDRELRQSLKHRAARAQGRSREDNDD